MTFSGRFATLNYGWSREAKVMTVAALERSRRTNDFLNNLVGLRTTATNPKQLKLKGLLKNEEGIDARSLDALPAAGDTLYPNPKNLGKSCNFGSSLRR
jgi:hypothetical protein